MYLLLRCHKIGDHYYVRDYFYKLLTPTCVHFLTVISLSVLFYFSSSQFSGRSAQLMKQYYTLADLKPVTGVLQNPRLISVPSQSCSNRNG